MLVLRPRDCHVEPLLQRLRIARDASESPTMESPSPSSVHRPGSSDSAEFADALSPGQLLAGRYRILGLLGVAGWARSIRPKI